MSLSCLRPSEYKNVYFFDSSLSNLIKGFGTYIVRWSDPGVGSENVEATMGSVTNKIKVCLVSNK